MSDKIERVRKATIELTLEGGYDKLSIRKIAKKANVSTGYLYRYYEGKQDLIEDIVQSNFNSLQEQIEQINTEYNSFAKIMEIYLELIFNLVKEDRTTIEFLAKIVVDRDTFNDSSKKHIKEKEEFIKMIFEKGIEDGSINKEKITFPLFISIFLTLPFGYLVQGFRLEKLEFSTNEELFNENVIKKLLNICLDALK